MQFETLEHTADIGIRAWGASLPELFTNAALAVEAIALDISQVEPRNLYELVAEGEDAEALLVNWLNEVIFYLDGRHIAFARFEISEFTGSRIAVRAWGEPRDPARHAPRLVVKAATYHQLRLAQEDHRWVAEVFLDI